MGIPIVWGTRVRETAVGAIAVNCRYCGELTIADCFGVATADHVYFIHGKFRHSGFFIKCRLCGIPQEMPPATTPVQLATENETRPSPDFLRATNPGLAEIRPSPVPLEEELPPSVSRKEWSIVHGISVEIRRQDADDKVSGNIDPLYLLTLMGAAGGAIAIWLKFEHRSKTIPLALLVTGTCVLLFLIMRLHRFLLNRALHREMAIYVRRNLTHTGNNMQSLVAAAVALGRDYRAVAAYLRWAGLRMR
jgi:hypothetical protein